MSPAGPTEATPQARRHHRRSAPRRPQDRPLPPPRSISIYHLMNKSPRLRTGVDVSLEDLKAARERHSGDMAAMAADFEVSEQGLRRRLRQVGLM